MELHRELMLRNAYPTPILKKQVMANINKFFKIKVHGKYSYYGVYEYKIYPGNKVYTIQNFYISEFNKKKKKFEWVPTIICPLRARKKEEVSIEEIIDRCNK